MWFKLRFIFGCSGGMSLTRVNVEFWHCERDERLWLNKLVKLQTHLPAYKSCELSASSTELVIHVKVKSDILYA
jgi:hypothetical protein